MVTSVNSKMTAIADAIRNLLDISGTMGLDAMASNISSITKRGAVAGTISTKSEQYIIPAGYHNGNGTVGIDIAEQAKIIAENIKNGVTILGVSGTASGDAYAVIAVTYPAGSVCTCSDGTKTLKLKDTSGQGFFLIPYAAAWTVTATDGTNTKAQSVEITSEGQSESVTLSYELDIFANGVLDNSITGGFENSSRLSIVDNNLKVLYGVAVGVADTMDVTTKNSIDVSAYNNVKLDVVSTSSSGPFAAGQEISLQIIRNNNVLGQISLKGYKNQTAIMPLDAYKSGGAVKLRFHMACNEGGVSAIISRFYLE